MVRAFAHFDPEHARKSAANARPGPLQEAEVAAAALAEQLTAIKVEPGCRDGKIVEVGQDDAR
jgi:hypothetical protein